MTGVREGLRRFFADRPTRAGLLARRALHCRRSDDRRLAGHLIAATAGSAGPDGSVRGSLVATAQAVLDLDDVGYESPERDRMVGWLLGRQGEPGAFHEGCTAARHQHRTCEHFLDGFFSPAPPARRTAPVALANGKEYRIESQARFAASCVALEAVTRSGRRNEARVERHLDSFGALVDEWASGGDYLAADLAFSAMAALAAGGERWRPTLIALTDLAAAWQLADGTWAAVDFFNALDGLCRADAQLTRGILERAAPTLARRQREDGSFGSVAADHRALVALRVLLTVEGDASAAGASLHG